MIRKIYQCNICSNEFDREDVQGLQPHSSGKYVAEDSDKSEIHICYRCLHALKDVVYLVQNSDNGK